MELDRLEIGSGAGQWQTVVNTKKSKKQEGGKDSKKSVNAAPEPSRGVRKDRASIFSALDEASEERRVRILENKPQKYEYDSDRADSSSSEADEDNEEAGEKQQNGNDEDRKKKVKKIKKPKVQVHSAAQSIDVSELSAFLVQISETFKDSPETQLMKSADYFAKAFSSVTGFSLLKSLKDLPLQKAAELPLSSVPEAVISKAGEWFSQHNADHLGSFALKLLKSVIDELHPSVGKHGKPKGSDIPPKALVGLLVLLAILFRKRPDVILLKAEELRGPEFTKVERLNTLGWAFSQVAEGDLYSGMWLWVRNLLPLAVGKQGTPLGRDVALTFFDSVICKNLKKARSTLINAASRKGERLVPPGALDSVLRASYPTEANKTKATSRFASIFHLVKEIALASSINSKTTKPAAQQLLLLSLQAASEEPPALSDEACSIFLWCLMENEECYKQWENLHTEHMFGSVRVLSYLVREWKTVKGKVSPYGSFRKLLRALISKNGELLKSPSASDIKQATKANALCKKLLSKTSYLPSCVTGTVTLAVAAAIGYGFFELRPGNNPWGWDGLILLSRTHPLF